MRTQILDHALVGWCVVATVSLSAESRRHTDMPSDRALQFFERLSVFDSGEVLRALRPAPLDADTRQGVLAALPVTGELNPSSTEAEKLAQIEDVLVYHDRQSVFQTKVIDVRQAFVGLHARSVLLISRPALRLLSGAELEALVAHEVGHEYFWEDYAHARAAGDTPGLHEVELKCDGIGVLTLVELGLDPALLVAAARKLTRYNEAVGALANMKDYPGLIERARFARDLVAIRRRMYSCSISRMGAPGLVQGPTKARFEAARASLRPR
jgi:hypothetical protein